MFKIFKIDGQSMYPKYQTGDFILVFKAVVVPLLKVNREIVFDHPIYGLLIKKIDDIDFKNQSLTVSGTSIESIKSEAMGKVKFCDVIGFPVYKVSAKR